MDNIKTLVVNWLDKDGNIVFEKAYQGKEDDIVRQAFLFRKGSKLGKLYTINSDLSLSFYRNIIPL